MHKTLRIFFFLALILFPVKQGFSQSSFNSPYSSFGLGDLTFKGFSRNRAMGGISLGLRNADYIDFSNPASYSSRDSLSMLFEFGAAMQASQIATEDKSETPWDMNFSHLAFSFPVHRKVAVGAGLIPFSVINYNFIDNIRDGDDDYDPDIGEIDYIFRGEGGMSQIFFGASYSLARNLSVGVNTNFIFGNVLSLQTISFLEEVNSFNPKIQEEDLISGFNFDIGLQYYADLGNDWEFVAGGKYTKQSKVNVKTEFLKTNVLLLTGTNAIIDTLDFSTSTKRKEVFPSNYGIGFSVSKGEKFLIGMDYKATQWENSSILNSDSLANSNSLLLGIEYTPRPGNFDIYPLRMHYRVGAYYTNSYLKVHGNQINDFGITFGLGFPIGRIGSSFNLAFDYGRRGSKFDNLILENHGMFTFSLSLYDIWFRKFKYN